MGRKFLLTAFCFSAFSALAGGMDQMGNMFGDGSGAGLSSGGFNPPMDGSFGGNSPAAGGDQSVIALLRSQGMNFYVGGALGLSMFKGTLMATEGNITGSPQPVGHKKNLKNKMPAVALTFGLQQKGPVLTDFGVMALYGATTINQKTPGRDNAVTDKNTIQEKYRFVLHAAAGVPLTPAVSIFGKLGLVYSNFSIGYKEVGTSNGATESMMGLGVAPGIMVQYKVSETLSTNLDLSYIIYKGMATNNLAAKIANYSYKTKIAPRIMTVMIGGSMKLGAGS